jgi:ectoine hydroxylase-related dioxygenase (phytanoyl-CoA dioxygenase family)
VELVSDHVLDLASRGVTGPVRLLDSADAERLAELVPQLVETKSPIYDLVTPRDRHLDNQAVLDACSTAPLVAMAESIFCSDVQLWRSKIMIKSPTAPEIGWHRDGRFPGSLELPALENPLAMSAWIALTPVTLDNGGLEFIPGSHLTSDADQSQRWGVPARVTDSETRWQTSLDPGEAVVFVAMALHRSASNHSQNHRVGLVARFTPTDNPVYGELRDGLDGQGHDVSRYRPIVFSV